MIQYLAQRDDEMSDGWGFKKKKNRKEKGRKKETKYSERKEQWTEKKNLPRNVAPAGNLYEMVAFLPSPSTGES